MINQSTQIPFDKDMVMPDATDDEYEDKPDMPRVVPNTPKDTHVKDAGKLEVHDVW